jgi:hypothetical protein
VNTTLFIGKRLALGVGILTICPLACCLLVVSPTSAAPSTDPAVIAAQRRQDTVKSFAVEYKQTEVVAKGGISAIASDLAMPQKNPIPPEETTLTSVNRLVLDGQKVRFEHNHPVFYLPTGAPLERRNVFLFNGTLANQFFPHGLSVISESDTPQGIIKANAIADNVRRYELGPIIGDFRGMDVTMGAWPYSDLMGSGASLQVAGANSQEYVKRLSPSVSINCWLDPAQDYLPRRVRCQKKGQLDFQLDIRYRLNEEQLWVPASWVYNQYSPNGSLRNSQTFEVLNIRINEPEPASQFDIEYPPGTEVNDQRTDKWYRIQPGGAMREFSRITGADLSATIDQPGAPWYRQHQWLLIAIVIAVAVTAAAVFVQWRRRAKQPC